jgi:hypothetical protein
VIPFERIPWAIANRFFQSLTKNKHDLQTNLLTFSKADGSPPLSNKRNTHLHALPMPPSGIVKYLLYRSNFRTSLAKLSGYDRRA